MKNNKILSIVALLMLSVVCAFAVESVDIIKRASGKVVAKETVQLKTTDDGAKRLVVKKDSIDNKIDCIDIFPSSAKAKKGDDGYFIFARGEYINFTRDKFSIVRPNSIMPIFGAKVPKETFVGIAKTMIGEYSLHALATKGKFRMFMRFQPKKICGGIYEDIVIDFYSLTGNDANYSGMGRKYREIRLRNKEITPIRERIKTNKHLAQSWDRVLARLVVCGVMPTPKEDNLFFKKCQPIQVMATFDKQKEIIKAIKDAGIKEATLVLPGWQRGGFNGNCPDIFPIPEEFGGEAKLRELIKYANDEGYPLTPNADHTCAYYSANMWDEDFINKRTDGSLCSMGIFGGGRMHYICLKRSWELFIKKQMHQIKDLGFDGSYYIDVFSARPPDPCYDKNHFATRKEIAKVQNEILSYARNLFGTTYCEAGYDHCIESFEGANYTSGMDYWQEYRLKELGKAKIFDGIYPLWEIVYHGTLLSTPGRTTQNNVIECFFKKDIYKDDAGYDPWRPLPKGWLESEKFKNKMLRLVEWGARPAIYDLTIATVPELKAIYEFYEGYKHLQLEFMDSHEEIVKGVFLVKYSDGSEIVVNYNDTPYTYKNQVVSSKNYKLFKP